MLNSTRLANLIKLRWFFLRQVNQVNEIFVNKMGEGR